ncbi:MAG: HAD family phosphatase [Chloroflexi bacterium]|nr:HAD family phosphatase [Chloroflexota bacterium]
MQSSHSENHRAPTQSGTPSPAASRLPLIVFDIGGVLLDWNPYHLYRHYFNDDAEAVKRFLAEIGFHQWNVEQDKGLHPFDASVAELARRHAHYYTEVMAYGERWEETVSGPIQPTVDLLYELRDAGYPLYGLSNWDAEKFAVVRRKYAFMDCFEDIIVSGEVRLVKPEPPIYNLLLERTGREAGECLFIDDSLNNVTGAKNLGFQTIQFTSPQQLRQEMEQRGILSPA